MKLIWKKFFFFSSILFDFHEWSREHKNDFIHVQSRRFYKFFSIPRFEIDWNFITQLKGTCVYLIAVSINSGGCSKPGHTRSANTYRESEKWWLGIKCPIVKELNQCGLSSMWYGLKDYFTLPNANYKKLRELCDLPKAGPLSFAHLFQAAEKIKEHFKVDFGLEIYTWGEEWPQKFSKGYHVNRVPLYFESVGENEGHYYLVMDIQEITQKKCLKCGEVYVYLHNNNKCKAKKNQHIKRSPFGVVSMDSKDPIAYSQWVDKIPPTIQVEVLIGLEKRFIESAHLDTCFTTNYDFPYGVGSSRWMDSEKAWKDQEWGFIHARVYSPVGIVAREGFSVELMENEMFEEWKLKPMEVYFRPVEGIFFSEYLYYMKEIGDPKNFFICCIGKSRVWKNQWELEPYPKDHARYDFIRNTEEYCAYHKKIKRIDIKYLKEHNQLKIELHSPRPVHVEVASGWLRKMCLELDGPHETSVISFIWHKYFKRGGINMDFNIMEIIQSWSEEVWKEVEKGLHQKAESV